MNGNDLPDSMYLSNGLLRAVLSDQAALCEWFRLFTETFEDLVIGVPEKILYVLNIGPEAPPIPYIDALKCYSQCIIRPLPPPSTFAGRLGNPPVFC